jgi:antitoxin (DNA-binding transcriptional repressor) of toxin-antitoxin stability system
MSKYTYSVTQAQSSLPRLLREAEEGGLIGISRRDETVAYLMSRDQLEAIVETMEIVANADAMKAVGEHRDGGMDFLPLSVLDDEA